MARMVLMKDTKPLVLRKEDVADDAVWVCRCGLSAKWPLCDSSHAEARKEKPDQAYRYHRSEPGGDLKGTTTNEATADADPRPEAATGGTA